MSTSPFFTPPETNPQPEPQPITPQTSTQSRILSELGWLGAGFSLPVYSIAYYRQAMRRPLKWAIWFFVLLAFILLGLSAMRLARGLTSAAQEIRAVYQNGSVPEIVIRDGTTFVNGPEPVVLVDSPQMLAVVDTTGHWSEIDTSRYSQGVLVTRYDMHLYNNGRYQVIPLIEYNQALNRNPIVINQETVLSAWNTVTTVLTVVAVMGMFFWNLPLRLGYLALLALILWGLTKAVRPQTRYVSVFIAGIYAFVPAMLISYLLQRLDINLPARQTLIWLLVWIAALVLVYNRVQLGKVRLWHALIGLPMQVAFMLDYIFIFPQGALIVTAALVLTMIVILVMQMLAEPEAEAPARPA